MQVYVWHCCCAVAFIQNYETAELALLMVFSFTFLNVQNADTTFLMLLAEHNSEVFIPISIISGGAQQIFAKQLRLDPTA
jgi:hypothetical protein